MQTINLSILGCCVSVPIYHSIILVPSKALLSLMGGDCLSGLGGGEMTYFHQEPPARAVVEKVGPAGDRRDPNRQDTGRTALSQSSMDPNVKGRGADERFYLVTVSSRR